MDNTTWRTLLFHQLRFYFTPLEVGAEEGQMNPLGGNKSQFWMEEAVRRRSSCVSISFCHPLMRETARTFCRMRVTNIL